MGFNIHEVLQCAVGWFLSLFVVFVTTFIDSAAIDLPRNPYA